MSEEKDYVSILEVLTQLLNEQITKLIYYFSHGEEKILVGWGFTRILPYTIMGIFISPAGMMLEVQNFPYPKDLTIHPDF